MQDPKSNIVILIGQLSHGGAEKQSLLLAKALSGQHSVCLVVFKPQKAVDTYLSFLARHQINHRILQGNMIARFRSLCGILRSFRTHILFCYLPADNLIGTLAGKLTGVPRIIGGIRNTKVVWKKFYLLRFVQNHFQDRVIFNSAKAREIFISKGYREKQSLVIENAFDETIDFSERPDQDPVRILMVGRFVQQKDYPTGLAVIADLVRKIGPSAFRLDIAGYGKLENQIRSWITAKGLDDLTEIHIQPANLPEVYQSADIYFNSSIHEGFSNAMMEAMAHGLPVVATRSGDAERLVLENETGYLAEVGDLYGLRDGLEKLILDHSTRIRFGESGHRRLYELFGFSVFREKYLHLIKIL